MAAIGKGIRVLQSPAALALTALFAMTRLAVAQPVVGAINANGIILCTNTELTCSITATTGTITNVSISVSTTLLGGGSASSLTTNINAFTTGLGTATANVSYPLTTNLIYTVSVTALDSSGASGSTNASFDTIQPILVIEAEDFNYSGGHYLNTPPNGGLALYQGQVGVSNIDEFKLVNQNTQSYYRPLDLVIMQGAAPNNGTEQKYVTAAANGDSTDVPIEVGYNSGGDWNDYTRDFGTGGTNSAPDGTYFIWGRMATDGAGSQEELSLVTSDATTSNQTTTVLGTYSFTDGNWNTFDYVPLLDQYGNLVTTTLSGHATLRGTVTDNPNLDFYFLMPASAILQPTLKYIYPNGPFANTNTFAFTVSAAQGGPIPSDGIQLTLNGQDVSAGLKLTGTTNLWTASFPINSNSVYTGSISVTNLAGMLSTFSFSFDTFNINNYQWEATDYDFSTNNGTGTPPAQGGETVGGWTSGLFFDNPVPSADTSASATGHEYKSSYFGYPGGFIPALDNASNGAVAQENVDFYVQSIQPYGTGSDYYRNDGQGSQPATDLLRPKFVAAQTQFNDPNIGIFNIGWTSTGDWENYTRHYPTGKFFIYGRLAGNSAWSGTTISMVTSGVGTASQTTQLIGSFADPNANGWQSYHWIPLVDASGNPVPVNLGGLATLRVTCGGGINEQYYMLVPYAPSTVPILVSTYPDGLQPFENTNSFSFTVSSASGAPIDSSGIGLTLNGVSVNGELALSSSSTNWTGSAPLVPNTLYSAVISVTNTDGEYSTFFRTFDTFNVSNYQWEATDYDYNNGQYIDNPVPTCDVDAAGLGEEEANSYFGYPANISGAIATAQVDFFDQAPQTIGGANDYYRFDGQGSQPATDYLRPKFLAAQAEFGDINIGIFNLGYTTAGDWENYTRDWPAGSYSVYGRIAGGGGAWSGTTLSMVTSGVGTTSQTLSLLGSFADANPAGWQAYHWIPMMSGGSPAVITLGGKATLRITCGGNVNEQYYMLVPAAPQLSPRIGASVAGGMLNISIPTLTGHNYQVVYSSTLSTNSSAWSAAGAPIVGDGTTHSVTEALSGTQGYYEIKVQ